MRWSDRETSAMNRTAASKVSTAWDVAGNASGTWGQRGVRFGVSRPGIGNAPLPCSKNM